MWKDMEMYIKGHGKSLKTALSVLNAPLCFHDFPGPMPDSMPYFGPGKFNF